MGPKSLFLDDLPVSRHLLSRVLRKSEFVLSAGGYAAKEGERAARSSLTVKEIPPGVDTERFKPLTPVERKAPSVTDMVCTQGR